LEAAKVDAPFGVDFYVWIPVVDHRAPKMKQLEFGVFVLEKLVALKQKVYVHCKSGHGRAPTLVAAYFIKTYGLTSAKAIAFIKKRRKVIHLEKAQKETLEKFAKKFAA